MERSQSRRARTRSVRRGLDEVAAPHSWVLEARDLPVDEVARSEVLLRLVSTRGPQSEHERSRARRRPVIVAVVARSEHADADLDCLVLQVDVSEASVREQPLGDDIAFAITSFAVELGIVLVNWSGSDVRVRSATSGDVTIVITGASPA